ncbi:uncharacterized protein LOC131620864 [Vicia villosa]|uniref:uncharacterized protein LOC131620864 n=1 Tax=Vicia villosa TaxID=3911 RepID=UPI00273B773A|nr:uncharacterized protein LOC131620864 [Vicia villosa]
MTELSDGTANLSSPSGLCSVCRRKQPNATPSSPSHLSPSLSNSHISFVSDQSLFVSDSLSIASSLPQSLRCSLIRFAHLSSSCSTRKAWCSFRCENGEIQILSFQIFSLVYLERRAAVLFAAELVWVGSDQHKGMLCSRVLAYGLCRLVFFALNP